MSPQQLASTLWALAKLDVQTPETVQVILRQLVDDQLGILNAQDVANTLWALAKLDCLPTHELRVRSTALAAQLAIVNECQEIKHPTVRFVVKQDVLQRLLHCRK